MSILGQNALKSIRKDLLVLGNSRGSRAQTMLKSIKKDLLVLGGFFIESKVYFLSSNRWQKNGYLPGHASGS